MRDTTLQDYRERILNVLVHIQQNLDEALSLEDLARVACFSPYHFHRVFTGMVGETLKEHVRRLRLERAAMRLRHSEQPVTMIAFDAGYETHEAFTRAFKRLFAMPPSDFRQRLHSGIHASRGVRASCGVHFRAADDSEGLDFQERGQATMDVRIESIEPMRVAFMRHVGPYQECGPVWERLCAWMGAHGHMGADTRFLGLCHDDPEVTPPEKIRYDACLTVDEAFQPEGEVGVQVVPGGDHAVTTHHGPYERLKETYAELFGGWLPRSGREPRAAPCFEVYLNDPQSTEPEELLTDIYAPLEPKA